MSDNYLITISVKKIEWTQLELAGQGGACLGGVWKREDGSLLWHVSYELIFFSDGGRGFPGRMIKGMLQLGCPNFPRGVYLPMAAKAYFLQWGIAFLEDSGKSGGDSWCKL